MKKLKYNDNIEHYLAIFKTDHRALVWLSKMKGTNARITRWFLAVQPFDFEVLYRNGPENCTADFISRTPWVLFREGGGNVRL